LLFLVFSGTLASTFSIDSASAAITTGSLLDYESDPTSYGDGSIATLGVKATDSSGGTAQVAVTISVNDINDDPAFSAGSYTGSLDEEQSSGAAVTFGTAVAATDEDGHTITYSLVGMTHFS
jgi:hypothetical protein